MPVNEVAFLEAELGDRLDLVVANALRPDRFSDEEAEVLERAATGGAARPGRRWSSHHRARAQREQLERLRPDVTLPFAVDPADDRGGADLDVLADALAGALG